MEDDVLGQDPFTKGDNIFGELKDFTPTETKDEGDFKPLKGSYIARITKLQHNIGVSTRDNTPYDFYNLTMQIIETLDGDKGTNRYLSKRYQSTIEGIKKLMTDLFTAGISFDKGSREDFDLSLTNAIDKPIRLRAWAWTPEKKMDGTPIPEDARTPMQQIKIVAEFKNTKKSTGEVPF